MSDHVWASENIAAYLAGGLDPSEGERLEQHAAGCAACARALDEARALESKLSPLFRAAKPGAALEDRIIQSLLVAPPAEKRRRVYRIGWQGKAGLAVAAALLLAFIGWGVSRTIEDRLNSPSQSRNYLEGLSLANHSANDVFKKLPPREGLLSGLAPAGSLTPDLGVPISTNNTLQSADDMAKEIRLGVSALDKQQQEMAETNMVEVRKKTEAFDPVAKETPTRKPVLEDIAAKKKTPPPTPPGDSKFGGAGFGKGNLNLNLPVTIPPGYFPGADKDKKDGKGKDTVRWSYTNNGTVTSSFPTYQGYFKPGDGIAQLVPGQGKLELKEGPDRSTAKGEPGEGEKGGEKGPGRDGNDKEDGKKTTGKTEQPPSQDTGVKKPEPNQLPTPRKIIIRSGELEFEIDSFDDSLTTIMKLVTRSKGGFVATINSDKLANGKVRGSVVLRIPPDQLDQFILDLRKELTKAGELKNQRLGSEDISKHYMDLESRLRAARTMEQRLLNIIKEGKGQIKDLLQAEKELGVWRTKIEEMEGEIRYYNNLVSLATLTIKMYEKDIRMAALITENERIQAGIEVEDVEKAHKEALKAILDAKGRISRSELKQHAAGQFNAILHFEVDPEKAGPLRDRLKQIGTMVRLQIDRLQQLSNGGKAPKDGKVQRGDTQFFISIYNLANIAPRETITLRIAAADVPAVYQKLREKIAKAKGHVVNASLDEKDRQNINAQLDFNVSRAGQADIQAELAAAGETLSRQVTRVPDSDNVTDSKVRYTLVLIDADAIQPRETVTLTIAATDVSAAYHKLREAFTKTKARVINAKLDEKDRHNVGALLEFTFHRKDEGIVQIALTGAGETLARQVTRLPESPNLTDTKVFARVELIQADALPPRETVTLTLAAVDVSAAYESLRTAVTKAKGRITKGSLDEKDRRNVTGSLYFDVPRGDDAAIQALLTAAGESLTRKVERKPENSAVTETKVGFQVELTPASAISPRKTAVLALEVSDVAATLRDLNSQVTEATGRVVKTVVGQEKSGQVTARVAFDVPLSAMSGLVEKFKTTGALRRDDLTEDLQAPEGKLALGHIEVTLSSGEVLVSREQGFWSQIRNGLSFSLKGLAYSLYLLIVGLLFVLPWALLIYVAFLLVRRMVRQQKLAAAAPEAPAGNVPTAPAG